MAEKKGAAGEKLKSEKLEAGVGSELVIDQVLAVGSVSPFCTV